MCAIHSSSTASCVWPCDRGGARRWGGRRRETARGWCGRVWARLAQRPARVRRAVRGTVRSVLGWRESLAVRSAGRRRPAPTRPAPTRQAAARTRYFMYSYSYWSHAVSRSPLFCILAWEGRIRSLERPVDVELRRAAAGGAREYYVTIARTRIESRYMEPAPRSLRAGSSGPASFCLALRDPGRGGGPGRRGVPSRRLR